MDKDEHWDRFRYWVEIVYGLTVADKTKMVECRVLSNPGSVGNLG